MIQAVRLLTLKGRQTDGSILRMSLARLNPSTTKKTKDSVETTSENDTKSIQEVTGSTTDFANALGPVETKDAEKTQGP
jgi:hypothetical protein